MGLSSREGGAWRGSGWLEDALLLLVHGCSGRHGFSSFEGDYVNLESRSFGCGKNIN